MKRTARQVLSSCAPLLPGNSCYLRRGRRLSGGFTITELVVAIVVAGVLVAVAIPRWGGETGFEERGFRDEVQAALRYAQKTAITSHRRVCVTFTSTTLAAKIDTTFGAGDCAVTLIGPTGSALAVTASGSAQFLGGAPSSVVFDPLGRPGASVSITVQNLTVLPITIEAETGYVH